jgi:molybdate transport system ATP-binding protein
VRLDLSVRKRLGDLDLDVSFSASGGRTGLFGPSGCGKSSVVSMIAGLLRPDGGRIEADGVTLFDGERGIDLPPERRRVAAVFQDARLFPHLPVEGNLRYGFRRCPPGARKLSVESVASALELAPLLSRPVGALSGGERQRVALGRALLASPRLLLLDEPLSALDDPLKFRVIPYLRKSFDAFGVPFLFISHSLLEMRMMAERVVVLENGRVEEETDVESLAVRRMGRGGAPYLNLLALSDPGGRNGLAIFPWGGEALAVGAEVRPGRRLFGLSARDIILFRKHPEAISARNLLPCRVVALHEFDGRTGVVLACGTERLVAEIMRETAREMELRPGIGLYAAIKASAFRELPSPGG